MHSFEEYTVSKYIKSWKASILKVLREVEKMCFQDRASPFLEESSLRKQTIGTHENILSPDSDHMSKRQGIMLGLLVT